LETTSFIHSKPFEEDLLESATIIHLDLNTSFMDLIQEMQSRMRTGLAKLLLDANSEKVIDCVQQSQEVKIKSQSLQQDLQQCTTIISSTDSGL